MEIRGAKSVVAWGDPAMTGSAEAGAFVLPVGTVAFLLTDVEGSTRAWEAEPEAMATAMARHTEILEAAVSAHGGVCPPAQGEGDSVVAAFARPSDAVLAARDAQLALVAEAWPTAEPLRVRMAVHAGEARVVDDGNYAGQAIIRTARLRDVAHGGQVLVSAPARDLTIDHLGDAVTFLDLGEHRLRDLARPERVYQLQGTDLPAEFEPLASLDARPHNLPVQLSTFIGRHAEIATVVGLLGSNRLVTIAGAGGAGKTRLAQHVAAEVLDRFTDGTWWIELAEVNDPAAIAATVSAVVGVKAEVGEGAATAFADRLGARRALLVLDNCEHLVAGVAAFVDEVLRRCPAAAVLATSREPLEVSGEVAWRIPPLTLPAPSEHIPIAALPQYESVRLFVDRARSVRPNFHLTDENGPAVAAICTRLDGIPLALELAAARCRSTSPERILEGLTDVFHLLTSGGRTALPRQQTLEASIAWSHDLLAPIEQVLFRRLAVFSGGCTLDDAEAVLADDQVDVGLVLDLLDRLIAQSLVHLDDTGDVPRYRLLETVRQYATRRLDDAGEGEAFRRRHAGRFLTLAEEIGVAVEGPDEWPAYGRAVAERDNLALALSSLAAAGAWEDHARLTLGLAWVRAVTEPIAGLRDLTLGVEHVPTDSALAARLLAMRATARCFHLDPAGASADAAAATSRALEVPDPRATGQAQSAFGYLLAYVDPVAADGVLVAAIESARLGGDPFVEAWAWAVKLTASACFRGDGPAGRADIEAAEDAVGRLGNRWVEFYVDSAVAVAHCVRAEFDEAARRIERAELALERMASVTGLPMAYLLRQSSTGATVLFARAYLGSVDVVAPDLDEMEAMIETGLAEGQLFLPIAVATMVGLTRWTRGDAAGAVAELDAAAEHARAAGAANFLAIATTHAAQIRDEQGQSAEARDRLAAVEVPAMTCGSHFALARFNCAAAAFALEDGEIAEADRRAHEALSLARTHRLVWEGVMALEVLAGVAARTASPVEAARLAGAAHQLRGTHHLDILSAVARARLDATLDLARAALEDDAFDVAWHEGVAMDLEEVAAFAQRARGERKRPALGWDSLTPTERLVVEQVELGRTNPQIAETLLMSRDTVKTHLAHVFTKLGVKSRSELAAAAARRG
jgi:predicted ATPase/class 3 adenylate cyclase/DNA-binding CsgD family transcriptional regulator